MILIKKDLLKILFSLLIVILVIAIIWLMRPELNQKIPIDALKI